MNIKFSSAILSAIGFLLAACGGPERVADSAQLPVQLTPQLPDASLTGTIQIDGSSTVFPITEAIVKAFKTHNQKVQIDSKFSGTGGGFKRFCKGETHISAASRPILEQEMEVCRQAGTAYIELPIGFDALTIVVNPQNSWAKDITVAELKRLWEPAAQGKVKTWRQVRSSWPATPVKLFGPGKDSGTYDYFTEVVVGKDGASRSDYTASENDNDLVAGVSKDPGALGYFGFAYFEANQSKLKVLGIDNGQGIVEPSRETVEKAQYQPLARPLFIYVNSKAAQDKPELRSFVNFYLSSGKKLVNAAGYIPLPEEGYRLSLLHFERGKVGTVFGGTPQPNLTIGQLLRKQAAF
ncbi:PstS family phosphate ABC transporter substrate-binding protein [Altericista sp. CCNU0014]|uniref:PstS family phosphate ABC transporter substrate-binding protein n=1 Tax=Altericista sp. CCNU0014 TaxID=3082949 RepID=UPI00384FB550